MLKRAARTLIAIAGMLLGLGLGVFLYRIGLDLRIFVNGPNSFMMKIAVNTITALITGSVFYFLSPKIMAMVSRIAGSLEVELEKVPAGKMLIGSIGLIVGLLVAYLITMPIMKLITIPTISAGVAVLIYVIMGYLGITLSNKNISDLSKLTELFKRNSSKEKGSKTASGAKPKILDTSVIIDGRISDILKTGFIEGAVVIPEFVLEELRHIADSSDGLKRNRGRRGLDILRMIQQEKKIEVRISDVNFEDTEEVDIKLLKLAKKIDGVVVTNDFNLNKVAELQSVPVLNINELANAVKPVVLPGEDMQVCIVKDGKESNQGVAYLDDGTMIVVEGGRKFMNETIYVTVTSVLQTAAGRMIFGKPQV